MGFKNIYFRIYIDRGDLIPLLLLPLWIIQYISRNKQQEPAMTRELTIRYGVV